MRIAKDACRPKVVVVDDDADFLTLEEHWLKPKFDVTCLTGGMTTSDEIAALEPDLLVMDIHMPGRSGFEICRELHGQRALKDLPVIFLTASKSDKDFIRYLDLSGCRYMMKPVSGQELKEAVSEQLNVQMAGYQA